ncbi:hypothetical protein [Actinocrispum wychmicini]|uniref:Uncharacterized protein n=1 Tax=Actinocrispum wychmicini TaxID=1213861 RepID=A0A4R2JRK3_9PSEU|nr:hypothetical protein [Actinocrispum wychmicini]TCO59848.1 hypothetical protein EV192_104691 [Actinocrispum wychmicini]
MKLDGLLKPLSEGRRFFLVSYLPTCAGLLYLLLLVWAGAWGWLDHAMSFAAAWRTITGLGVGEVVAIVVAVTVVALMVQPFQLAMMRVLEGAWPKWLGAGLGLRIQRCRKERLVAAAELPQGVEKLPDDTVQKAGAAGDELRRRFPLPDHLLRPTALGNVLAAMEDSAGRAYGLDAVAAWPRLYPVLGEQVKAIVDDRRDALDAAARLAVTMMITTVAAAVLLGWQGWWLLLALAPLVVSIVAFRGTVQAALAYSEAVHVAFDLHRFDMLTALRTKLPENTKTERQTNERWCDLWRQGVPLSTDFVYVTDKKEP